MPLSDGKGTRMGQTKTKPKPKVQQKATTTAETRKSSSKNNVGLQVLSDAGRKKLDTDAELLERALEEALLADAILSARRALNELHNETRNVPHERRSGMRLREKALRVENAFNRLRALRRGELLPPAIPEE